ncbi:energy transducer TonB [Actomonas aquatica]|uniref:Energy transducer TonB n=1 Tax=Actomonas aquatica TaxID=2866162 RepID=A0ABZ1C9N6_9BACT|nr:energy transducer TonB [Opitutus sp. WL0086]WRQ87030.1 energy transducer TonB [Opitutus sp. WL0086]
MFWRRLIPLICLLAAPVGAAELEGDQPIEVIPVQPEYPREAKLRRMDGYARAVIEVDEQGQLVDYLIVEASHDYFVEGAINLIKHSIYRPAMVDGRPVPLRAELPIEFTVDGITINSDFQSIVDLYLQGGHARDRQTVFQATLQELDAIPVPIAVAAPSFPSELAQQGIVGKVVIDFFIDQAGKVRMPAIAAKDHEQLGTLALEAVRTWRFEPPLRDGHPVIVRVRQEFMFREGGVVAPSTP